MKTTLLSFALLLATTFTASAQIVTIPDANFKAYLVGNSSINTNMDAEIQVSEANSFTGALNCNNLGINDVTGLEAFTDITGLYLFMNNLTALDVSYNTALYILNCRYNQLTSLNLSTNLNLVDVNCSHNQITALDLSTQASLGEIDCSENLLTSLNVANGNNANVINIYFMAQQNPYLTCIEVDDVAYSNANWFNHDPGASFSEDCSASCTVNIPDANFKAHLVGLNYINTNGDSEIQCSEAIAYGGDINCSDMYISDLTGIESFTNITGLWCFGNQLTTLDVSSNTYLTTLLCHNNQLSSLTVSNSELNMLSCHTNSLTTLNTSNCTALTTLQCYGNQLNTLDLSEFPALTTLDCRNNQLTALDISTTTGLQVLSVGNNYLNTLNTSNNSALLTLGCGVNDLTYLNVSNNVNLTNLSCDNNQLTSLDIANLSWIASLNVSFNQLTSLNVANGNNINFTQFQAQGNNMLTCIQVDDAAYSSANWTSGNFMFDAQQDFDEDCGLGLNETEVEILNLYPNPVNTLLNVELKSAGTIQITNMFGEVIQTQDVESGINSLEISNLSSGIYFIQTQNGSKTKFVKK